MIDRVVVLEKFCVQGRLVDGGRVERYVEGVFTSFQVVERMLAAIPPNSKRIWSHEFCWYVATEVMPDNPDFLELGCRTYGQDGALWGDSPTWHDDWRGREASDNRFQLTEIVGIVWSGAFRWAIVVLLPMTPAEVVVLKREASPDCDLYTVYFADGAHTHAAEGELLRAPRPVPRKTRHGLLAAWRWTQHPASPRP